MKIQLETELGKGGSSCVKFARDVDTMQPVAAKVIELEDDVGQRTFKHESALMGKLKEHRNLPKLLGCCKGFREGKQVGYIVLEYLPFPTLSEYMKSRGAFPEEEAFYLCRQLVDVVTMLMKTGLAHRDLKPENMMINPDNLVLKLIDFGLGMTIKRGEDSVDGSYRGTPIYMAPEVIQEHPGYNIMKSELWSIAVMTFELLTGVQPFEQHDTRKAIVTAQLVGIDLAPLSDKAKMILTKFLEYEPKDRVDLAEAKKLMDENYPEFDKQAMTKRKWASSRAATFENIRSYTDVQAKARTGMGGSVHHRLIKREQPATEREIIDEARRGSDTPTPTPPRSKLII